MLSVPGMEKINFSGGEPFLQDRGEYLGSLVKFCKQELQLPSVSIVSNGSLIRERWFQKYGEQPPLHVTLASVTVCHCTSFHPGPLAWPAGDPKGEKSKYACSNLSSGCTLSFGRALINRYGKADSRTHQQMLLSVIKVALVESLVGQMNTVDSFANPDLIVSYLCSIFRVFMEMTLF